LAVQVHSTPPQSLTAGFELNGSSEVGELRLHSPLGTTLAIIRWRPGMAQLQRGSEWTEADSLNALSEQLLGTDVPVAALFNWLEGRSTEVPGWQVDMSRLTDGRLSAVRQSPLPSAELRLVLDR
jgi:outer membrane lipoprotein LolB